MTHNFVKSVTKPGTYGDGYGGHGLSLVVRKRSKRGVRKSWNQRIRIKSKQRDRGLGSFPVVSLAEARDKAFENARRVHQGQDITKPPPIIPTVEEAYEAMINQRAGIWKNPETQKKWRRAMDRCKPIFSTPVSEVTEDDVTGLLNPLWLAHVTSATYIRSHLDEIMDQAIRKGHRLPPNPVPTKKAMTRTQGKHPLPVHRQSLEHRRLGTALATIRDSKMWWGAKYCILFLAFTGLRNQEAREAVWEEVDLDNGILTIPANRMKNGIEHKVPLCVQAVRILTHVRELSGRSTGIIFPPQRGGHSMDKGRLSRPLKKLGAQFVPHGLRSSYRNWAGGRPRDHLAQAAAAMVIGHKPAPAIEMVYMTDTFFEEREPIMKEWANYLCETMGPPTSHMPEVQKTENLRVHKPAADPIGEAEYDLLVQYLQQSRPQGAPDQATLSGAVTIAAIGLMRDGVLDPQHAAGAHWPDLQREADGSSLLTIPFSKKDKSRRNKLGRGEVTYVSQRTTAALNNALRIRQELRLDVTDERLFRRSANKLRSHIKNLCEAAGLGKNFSGSSPKNGMIEDLRRFGAGVRELRRAKRWKIPASTNHAGRMALARTGAVAQWHAQKEKAQGAVKTHLNADYPQDPTPVMQNWANFLLQATVPVTPNTEE